MTIKELGPNFDKDWRNDLNNNFRELSGMQGSVNDAVNKAKTAEQIANDAKTTANSANNTSNSVQKQLDTIVINGDSSVEAAQARVDKYGNASVTLKERLDLEQTKTDDNTKQITILTEHEVSVYQKGATGIGLIDDTAAIQLCLDIAKEKGSVRIKFIDGSFRITKPLIVYPNTYLDLGNARLLRGYNGAFLYNGEAGKNYEGYNAHGNIIIDGGVLDGNILNFPTGFNAIVLGRGKNIILQNTEIRDVIGGHAVDLNACYDVTFYKCRFMGYKAIDSNPFREAVQISNHTIDSFGNDPNKFGVYDGTPTKNVKILYCEFGESGTVGTQSWPVGVGHHSAVHNVYNQDIYISGCTFRGMTLAGIRGFKFADTKITENTFEDCNRCISMDSAWGGTSDANKDGSGINSKMPQAGFNILIDKNTFKNTKSEIVLITGATFGTITAYYDDIKITNNKVENKDNTSSMNIFSFSWASSIIVENNTGRYGGRFINLSYCKNFTAGYNYFTNLLYDGINLSEVDVSFNVPVEGEPGYDPTITPATVASWYKNKGYSSNVIINGVKLKDIQRTGISLYGCWGFKIINPILESMAIATDMDRDAIRIDANSKDGEIINPTVIKNPSYVSGTGGANRHAVYVTSSCSNIRVQPGELDGKSTMKVNLLGTNVWNGNYYYSPNGTRYKMTISDSGTPVFTIG